MHDGKISIIFLRFQFAKFLTITVNNRRENFTTLFILHLYPLIKLLNTNMVLRVLDNPIEKL